MHSTDDTCARRRAVMLALGAAGLVTFAETMVSDPQRAWSGLLMGNFLFIGLALCGTVFVAFSHVFSAGWAVAFRRVPEAMSAYLPIGAALMLVTALGLPHLYPWARPEVVAASPVLQHKAPYLNVPFFLLRTVAAFAVWIGFSHVLRRRSRLQDQDGDVSHTRTSQGLSAAFLWLFTLTFIFCSFDWVMSLQPAWYSTLFPAYCFAGLLLGGLAAILALVIQLRRHGALQSVTDNHLYELARAIAAASTFWAYIWFCQYMLVYYTNMPEESAYYAERLSGAWGVLFRLNLIVSWIAPVLMLVPARTRRSPQWLLRIAAVVLAGRWLDVYLLVVPSLGVGFRLGLPEVLIPLGMVPLFMLSFAATFQQAGPEPVRDPYLAESVHLRV